MSNLPSRCVIDANVALKAVIVQPGSDLAERLFTEFAEQERARLFVPDFFFAECATALANYARLRGFDADDARHALSWLQEYGFAAVPTVEIIDAALDIALRHRVSGYDACYVAVAVLVGAPLVTADERLARALKNQDFDIRLLQEFA